MNSIDPSTLFSHHTVEVTEHSERKVPVLYSCFHKLPSFTRSNTGNRTSPSIPLSSHTIYNSLENIGLHDRKTVKETVTCVSTRKLFWWRELISSWETTWTILYWSSQSSKRKSRTESPLSETLAYDFQPLLLTETEKRILHEEADADRKERIIILS